MSADRTTREPAGPVHKANGVKLESPGLAIERLPGLKNALETFASEAPRRLVALFGHEPDKGAIETVQGTTLFQAINDCAGLPAAIYTSLEPQARLLIALDERIDELVVASVFGETPPLESERPAAEASQDRTSIEAALVVEFARALGDAFEASFAPYGSPKLAFEGLTLLSDSFALGRRDAPAAAARIALPLIGGAGECLLLLPQSFLMPFRKELEKSGVEEPPAVDGHWSRLMESEVQQTRLPVKAILEETRMTLGDVANLQVGGILPLQNAGLDAVRLDCSGRSMFRCRLGQGEGRYRLEITGSVAAAAG